MTLPTEKISREPIDWLGLPRRYINDGELETLVALANSVAAKVIIEIGCNTGRTSRVLLHNVPTIQQMVGVDVFAGYEFAKPIQRREVPIVPGRYAISEPRFSLILKRRGAFELTPADLPACDMVFIDGDHSRAAVEHDTALARQLVRPGGLIVWHDYNDEGTVDVKDVLDEFRAAGEDIRLAAGTWLAFQKV